MNVELILKTVGAGIAISGFLFGIWQYTKAQRWRKAEFAAKELDKLSSDSTLLLACAFLDWEERPLNLPEAFEKRAGTSTFMHRWRIMEKAMVPGIMPEDGREGFTWQEVLYREVFDHFFTYLDRLNHYIEINLIAKQDISILKYWLLQIAGSPLNEHKPVFKRYIEQFGYDGVNRLGKKLGVEM